MQRLTALLLLICFFAIQYGRIMSYWECRLMAATAAAKCDCEKIMAQADEKKGHFAASFPVKGISEEVYDHACCSLPGLLAIAPASKIIYTQSSPLTDADVKGIFQPPRC
ncbi:hypothetical protein [Pseudobacter ginsenosidimutans]|uniref:Uncharacterized protein n=1 Tax=Pseudobacter ginsenosidimutans TaxID=661488 RepID=A0A4Q7MCT7_9BACT|nr:hypothetical protein [Pseudobacter ginsenosidimutans]QEC42702.1 hypothetical protein FSB84_13765 [Pseudobacter ginsenosidimutans]RZS65143.1 hypothetical protein EV199_5899 [Pseudobacter ginsenosidimutans]